MESLSGVADANSHILIRNNTVDDTSYIAGISVHGCYDYNQAGSAVLVNNIVTNSWCGIELIPEEYTYLNGVVSNTGYGANYRNKNFDFNEYNPVDVNGVYPYIWGPGPLGVDDFYHEFYECDFFIPFLNQNCPYINAGWEYIEETALIGTTTDVNSLPDSNKIDLGFHHSNWNYSNAGTTSLQADFDGNYKVDYNDLAYFTDYWLFDYNEPYQVWLWDYDDSGKVDYGDLMVISEYWLELFNFIDFADFANQWQREVDERLFDGRPDLYKDGRIDFKDFAVLANEWGMTGSAEPNIQIDITGDGSNGYVEVGISNYTLNTSQAFLLVDGQYSERFGGFENGEHELVNVAALGPGPHQFKVVSLDSNSNITCSHIKETSFNTPFNYCLCNEAYEVNKPLYFCAYVPDGNQEVSVKALDYEDNILWHQTYTGRNLNGFIPEANTGTLEIDRIVFEKNPAGGMVFMNGGGSNSSVVLSVTPRFDPKNVWTDTRALLVFPDSKIKERNSEVHIIVENAFKAHNVHYYKLQDSQATTENFAWFAQNRDIQYIYLDSHGNYKFNDVLRTAVQFKNSICFSFKQNDFDPNNIPTWCKKLPSHLETTGKSFYAMGFHTLKFVEFNACYSGRLVFRGDNLIEGSRGSTGLAIDVPNDMTKALDVDYSYLLYQGWWDVICMGSPTESMYSKFNANEWGDLRDGYTFYESISFAISRDTETNYCVIGRPPNLVSEDLRLYGRDLFFYLYGIE